MVLINYLNNQQEIVVDETNIERQEHIQIWIINQLSSYSKNSFLLNLDENDSSESNHLLKNLLKFFSVHVYFEQQTKTKSNSKNSKHSSKQVANSEEHDVTKMIGQLVKATPQSANKLETNFIRI